MTQPNLFSAAGPPAVPGGPAADRYQLAYELVRLNPGCTSVELWERALTPQRAELGDEAELRRRLAGLLARHWVRHAAARACRVRGSEAATWYAVNAGWRMTAAAIRDGELGEAGA